MTRKIVVLLALSAAAYAQYGAPEPYNPPAQSAPTYGAAAPPAQAPSAYSAPPQAPPTYSAPLPQAPPTYAQPAAAPVYGAPAQSAPAYAPAAAAPAYAAADPAPQPYEQPAAAAPAYGESQQYAPAADYNYAPQYAPQYGIALPPNVDVNYCSVHASYPLINTRDDKHHDDDDDDSFESEEDDDDYGRKHKKCKKGSKKCHDGDRRRSHRRHSSRRHMRRWDRQTCRYTAIFSNDSCVACCRGAARSDGVDTAKITGALFSFAPWDDHDAHKTKSGKMRRVVQCVCCAPRV